MKILRSTYYSLAALALAGSSAAQTKIDLRTQTKTVDFSQADSTLPSKTGTTLPTTCAPGQTFLLLNALPGQNVYVCTASNQWSLQGVTTLGGDLSGALTAATVSGLQSRPLAATAPTAGQALTWSGTEWQPGTIAAGVTSAFGRTGAVTGQAGDYSASQVTNAVNLTTPNSYSTGARQTFAGNATSAGIQVAPTALPSAAQTGDMVVDAGASNQLKFYNGSSWVAVPAPSSASPAMDGTAAPGLSANYARADHVHPTDTSRQAAITGAPSTWPSTFAPSAHASTHAAAGSDPVSLSASQIGSGYAYSALSGAPTIPSASSASPAMDGTAAPGLSANYARADHVHPTDTSRQAAITGAPSTWPSTFAPSAHASTHAAAGSDPVSLSASQIGSGYAYSALSGAPTIPSASSASPAMDGTAAPGLSANYARADHVHPTDTSRQAAITGAPSTWPSTFAPSAHASTHAAAGSDPVSLSASQIGSGYAYSALSGAPTIPSASSASPAMDGTAAPGLSANYARADHVHPTDTSRAPTASPTFTGTVNAGGATHTLPAIVAASVGALPTTGCTAGELAVVTGATAGQQLYENSTTGGCTWTQQSMLTPGNCILISGGMVSVDPACPGYTGPGYGGTSSTSLSITTGTITLTTGTGLAWQSTNLIYACYDTLHCMGGPITSYNSATGSLVFTSLAAYEVGAGAGPYTSWALGPIGPQGPAGTNGSAGATGAGYGGTSATQLTIGTGLMSLTTQTGLAWQAPNLIQVCYDSTHCMGGTISSYTSGTGALVFTSVATYEVGAGTYSSWVLGPIGVQGPAGTGNMHTLVAPFDGGGAAIPSGTYVRCSYVPFTATITGWYIDGDQPGSATFGVRSVAFASYTGTAGYSGYTDVTGGGTAPTVSSNVTATYGNLTSWATSVSPGYEYCFQLSGVSGFQWVHLTLTMTTN